jgi:hypothetical protein
MAATLKLGDRKWATKEGSLLAYNDENNNYKPLPFDFTRASSATRVNKQGLIETVASGVPRIDFTDANGALLLEPQRTNLFLNSEPTSNEGAMAGVSYESFDWAIGFTNCVKFGDNSTIRYRYGASAVNATQYAVSAFVIMDDLSEPVVSGLSSNGDFSFAIGGSLAYSVNPNIDMGNNIWKVSASIPSGGNSALNGIIKYTTQSNKGFRVVGYQLEEGSYATSYIPTQGSAVTVLADNMQIASGISDLLPQGTGTMYVEGTIVDAVDTEGYLMRIGQASFANTIFIARGAAGDLFVFYRDGNSTLFSMQKNNVADTFKAAFAFESGNSVLYVNGEQVGTSSVTYTPSVTYDDIRIGGYSVNTANMSGLFSQALLQHTIIKRRTNRIDNNIITNSKRVTITHIK